MIKNGGEEEARNVRAVYDVCESQVDSVAISVDVDAQGSSLHEDYTNFPLNFRLRPSYTFKIIFNYVLQTKLSRAGSEPQL